MTRLAGFATMIVFAIGLAGWLPVSAQDDVPAATPAASGVVRDVLHSGLPDAAPGELLELVRYTIQPGTQLAAHMHPGMQIAYIESGTLSYTVIEGSVDVVRAGDDGTIDTIGAGESSEIQPGDRFSEDETLVHFGANNGSEPVVILVSSLFTEGEPPSHPVEMATPAA